MKSVSLKFSNSAVAVIDGVNQEINLIDALSGKFGVVKGINVVLEVEQANKPAVPFVKEAVKAAAQGAADVANGVATFTIKKASKIWRLMDALMKKKGVTFDELKAILGMSDGGTGSYLYYYPAQYGCKLRTEKTDKGTFYHLDKPANVTLKAV